MNTYASNIFTISDPTTTEIYNAIDGSVWFEESDIDQLAQAVESNDLTEIGRLYVAMLEKEIIRDRERSKERAKEFGNFFRDTLCPVPKMPEILKGEAQYELTELGQYVVSDDVCRKAGLGA